MESAKFLWSSNITFLRNRRKLSQEDLAQALGISRSKLAALESGATKNPSLEDLVKISDCFHIAIDQLVRTDLSKMGELRLRELETGVDAVGGRLRILVTTVTNQGTENVEVVPRKAKAGYAAGHGDPDFIAELPVCTLPQLPRGKKYRIFPISGDSMLPIVDGSDVIVEYIEDWTSIKTGLPCVVITKNEGIVFKIVDNHIQTEGKLTLRSLNPQFPPFDVEAREVLEVWKFHSYISKEFPDQLVSAEHIWASVKLLHEKVDGMISGRK